MDYACAPGIENCRLNIVHPTRGWHRELVAGATRRSLSGRFWTDPILTLDSFSAVTLPAVLRNLGYLNM